MKEAVRKEVLKWLDTGVIYPISDSLWVSPVQVVPKKGGTTMIINEKNELLPTRIVTRWRICIDYRRLNKVTRKDHFPLPFIDQMLDRLAGNDYFCFLDGYLGYNQITIASKDQEKTTFKSIEVFMDDFSVIGSTFDDFLHNLTLVLKRCMETNLVLNWEKCYFMVREGMVLGHRVSGRGIEVD